MGRMWALAVSAALCGAAALAAEEIFWDGFEYGDRCAWSNPPVSVTQELEAFDESGANDEVADAEPIGRCAVVEGTIGEPYLTPGTGEDLVPDTDFYEVDVAGPVLLRIRLERFGTQSDFEASGFVVSPGYSTIDDFGLTDCGYPAVTTRQIYLPENGFVFLDPPTVGEKQIPGNNKWFINVDDGRNFDPCLIGVPPGIVGGADLTYRLTLSIDPVVGPTLSFMDPETPVQMPGDGSVLIYRLADTTPSPFQLAETFIDRTDPGRLDTKLFLVRKVGSQLTTVAGNDDFDFVSAGFDSRIGTQALTANTHFVIVDYYEEYENGPIDLELTLQFPLSLWH